MTKSRNVRLPFASVLALALLNACSVNVTFGERPLSPGTDWVANSSSWADEANQVFEAATAYVLEATEARPAGSWAVVMDLDETVLNNVQYQVMLENDGKSYTPENWYEWTQEEGATLVPGSLWFINAVNSAGGHVAFVTNRRDREQLATENNLAKLGIVRGKDFRVLLTRASPQAPGDKDDRFSVVPNLLAVQGYPDVTVVAYVGDSVGDKPSDSGEAQFFCIDQGAMYGEPCAEVPGPGI